MDNLPQLNTGSLLLIVASPALGNPIMTDFTARLALGGPVRVLDGGNRFAAYPLARTVRRYSTQLKEVMGRIQIARAFTCYQMLALLAQSAEMPIPTLVLDLIATFLDESVALIERRYLLRQAADHLLRLSNQAPVAVSSPPLTAEQPGDLLQMLVDIADRVVRFEEPPPPHTQLSLF